MYSSRYFNYEWEDVQCTYQIVASQQHPSIHFPCRAIHMSQAPRPEPEHKKNVLPPSPSHSDKWANSAKFSVTHWRFWSMLILRLNTRFQLFLAHYLIFVYFSHSSRVFLKTIWHMRRHWRIWLPSNRTSSCPRKL